MKLLILALSMVLQITNTTTVIVPSKDAQALLKPILDRRAEAESAEGQRQKSAFAQSEQLIARLFQTKTRASDEAVVVLMNFYVGNLCSPT